MAPPLRGKVGTPAALATAAAVLSAAPRAASGGLPAFSEALGEYLWRKAEATIKGKSTSSNEQFVCGVGNWGDGPQCNQWDQGFSPCWPSTMTISGSWDVDLMRLWSKEMAEEFGVTGRGQLGPGINLARFAWNGRLGEYMAGEDPYFGAKMVSAMVTAYREVPNPPLQTAKHFIPNTIETRRNQIIEEVDERTLFEVYYPPFEAAVSAGVSGVMCSYNLVKCTTGKCSGDAAYACANDDILNKHLKDAMGFKGIVISDWDATKCQDAASNSPGCKQGGYIDNDYAAESGLDLEMPSCVSFRGGVSKRAEEKATRLAWAYLNQGRDLAGHKLPPRRLSELSNSTLPADAAAAARRLTQMAGHVAQIQWSNHPNKCLQVDGDKAINGMRVQLWDCHDTPKQHWIWKGTESKIHWAKQPKMCLDVSAHEFQDGTPLQMWECLENDNDQLFTIASNGDGKIRSKEHPNMCVDVSGHKTFNGNHMQLWECLDHDDDQILSASVAHNAEDLGNNWAKDYSEDSDDSMPKVNHPPGGAGGGGGGGGAPAPSWNTGVYEDNPFAPSAGGGAAPAPAPAPGGDLGPTARKSEGPSEGRTCPNMSGDNYKSPCKLALADRIIAESTAILKNDGGVLPLKKSDDVALVGKQACAANPIAQGKGSGWNGFACNKVGKVNVRDGIAGLDGGPSLSCPDAGGDNAKAADADIVLVSVSPAFSSEGSDRATLQLDADDVSLIRKYAGMGKKVVVATNAPGPLITSTWDQNVAAIAVSWLPGQQNGRGIAQALYNDEYEASGRLPFTFPRCSTAQCTQKDEYTSVALGTSIANNAYVKFTEKALIGYRWYHAKGIDVSYPFGFGLFAYGSSEVRYSRVIATQEGKSITVTSMLNHDGPTEGRDVPQLYLKFPSSVPGDAESKPEWVLKGFKKVSVKPKVPTRVSFDLTQRDLSYWDDAPGRSLWVCAQGKFTVCVGANSRDAVRHEEACTTFTPKCDQLSDKISRAEVQASSPSEEAARGVHLLSPAACAAGGLATALAVVLAMSRRMRSPSNDAKESLVKSSSVVAGKYEEVSRHSA